MNNDLDHTAFETGAFVSEDAVRGALKRRPSDRSTDASQAPAAGPRKLRRWSVAELIARAVPRPPAGGLAH